MSEQAATEQLMAHIEALIVEHDRRDAVELVQGVFRSQIAINTQAELENRALREAFGIAERVLANSPALDEWPHAYWQAIADWNVIRQRLATDHGLPLPGAGEGGA